MNWLQRMMIGRYGVDQLSKAMLILTLILLIISSITGLDIINVLGILVLALSYMRILSRNIDKRYQENMRFLQWLSPIRARINTLLKRFKEHKTHRFYRCPQCNQQLRVPKGKGKIRITCPKCKSSIIKRT
ncbi:Zn-finger containing protein [Proteiniborus sp. DW1]|uniref:hypothetical protein n=1 Tax=Proteiniborus sp. DW1 TaxID=1889883 RepID=UPI00092DF688|nr:hypothetical protein [Proteiniborus sp. DW1]SCG84297.1 Zn-finger containing protein [Proteiniborus sp. DW1]